MSSSESENCSEPESRSTGAGRAGTSSDGSVERLTTESGVVLYRLKARVLPFLPGFLYLVGESDPSGSSAAGSFDWTLVDAGSGTDESNADVERALRIVREEFEPNFRPEKIRRIILTHAHADHAGGANEWSRRTGAEVWVHSFESRIVSDFDAIARVTNLRYTTFLREAGVDEEEIPKILRGFGFLPGLQKSAPVSRTLVGGEKVGGIEFFYFPGHSSGHLALLIDDLMLSGDLLLSKTLTQIWPARVIPQTGVLHYVESLKRAAEIAVDFERRRERKLTFYPAHEDPIFDVPRRVELALRAMKRRDRRLLQLLLDAETPLSLVEIARRMYWSGRPNREFFALSDVASRVEFLRLFGGISFAETEKLSDANRVLRFKTSFADAELAENAVEQVFRMRSPGN